MTEGVSVGPQVDGERTFNPVHHAAPIVSRLPDYNQAKIAQDLGSLSLPGKHIDPSGLQKRLVPLQSLHRVERFGIQACGRLDPAGPVKHLFVGKAINQFFALAPKLQGHRPDLALAVQARRYCHPVVRAPLANASTVPEVARTAQAPRRTAAGLAPWPCISLEGPCPWHCTRS